MATKPTYEKLEQRVKELQEEANKGKQVEEALGATHLKLHAAFDAIQEVINVVDLDFNVTDVNDILIKAFGLPDKKSTLGRKCFEVLKGRKDICPNCAVAEVYRTKASAYRTSTPEDEKSTGGRSFEIFAYPITDQDGNLTGAVEFARDITERKQAEEALKKAHDELEQQVRERTAKLSKANEQLTREIQERAQAEAALKSSEKEKTAILNATMELVVYLDTSMKILWANRTAGESLGLTAEKLAGRYCYELWCQQNEPPVDCPAVKALKTGQPHEIELSTSDDKHWIHTGYPIFDTKGSITGVVTTVLDITDRKRTEEALQKREAELEAQSNHLQEVNTALKVLLTQREEDRSDLEEKVLSNVKQLVSPHLQRLKKSGLDTNQRSLVSILESNLDNIVSSFTSKLSLKSVGLTPMEIRTADLVKEGKTNKEIGEILCLSPNTVKFHRYNLRNKLGLKNKKINLRSHLQSLVK